MDCDEAQQEELDALICIYDDIWVTKRDKGYVVHAPVRYADGTAAFICQLHANYPQDPIRAAEDIQIEGVPPELEATVLAMLDLKGLVASDSVEYERSGDPVLFDMIVEVIVPLSRRLIPQSSQLNCRCSTGA